MPDPTFENTAPNLVATLRFVIGSMHRERERLAGIFRANQMPAIASQILDASQDAGIFKWPDPQEPHRDQPLGAGEPQPVEGTPG